MSDFDEVVDSVKASLKHTLGFDKPAAVKPATPPPDTPKPTKYREPVHDGKGYDEIVREAETGDDGSHSSTESSATSGTAGQTSDAYNKY